MYKPLYTRGFEKEIKKFPKREQDKILAKMESIVDDPRKYATKLETTKPPIYKLRVGEYRVFFGIDSINKTIDIIHTERRTTQTYRQ